MWARRVKRASVQTVEPCWDEAALRDSRVEFEPQPSLNGSTPPPPTPPV